MPSNGSSESRLLLSKIRGVAIRDSKGLDARNLLRFDHFNAVALLVDHQAVFLPLQDLLVLFVLAQLLILAHLGRELLFVVEEGVASGGHLHSFLFLLLLLLLNDL